MDKLEDAIIAIDQAILLETDFLNHSAYYYSKSIALYDLSKFKEAIEACELSIKSNPNNHLEKLWQHIKDAVLKNKVYSDLDFLEDQVAEFINNISKDTIMSVCNCSYV